jgi:hypothetical protein
LTALVRYVGQRSAIIVASIIPTRSVLSMYRIRMFWFLLASPSGGPWNDFMFVLELEHFFPEQLLSLKYGRDCHGGAGQRVLRHFLD